MISSIIEKDFIIKICYCNILEWRARDRKKGFKKIVKGMASSAIFIVIMKKPLRLWKNGVK